MKIFLIGMPGSGKSTVGRSLAQRLSLEFLDLDKYIELQQGMSIAEIFEKKGEAVFRKLEAKALSSAITIDKDLIVSCGGGTPCHYSNMDVMLESGTTIFIDVPLAKLIERTAGKITRPLLVNNPSEKLESLLNERLPYFSRAHHRIDASKIDSEKIAIELTNLLQAD